MSTARICAGVVLPLVLAGTALAAETGGTARVRIASTNPLELRGEGFKANQRVALHMELGAKVYERRVQTSAQGKFAMKYENLVLDRCSKRLAIKAVGARGDRVEWELQTLPCPNRATR